MNRPHKSSALLPNLIVSTLLLVTVAVSLYLFRQHDREKESLTNKLVTLQGYVRELELELDGCRKTKASVPIYHGEPVTAPAHTNKTTNYLMHRKVTLPR